MSNNAPDYVDNLVFPPASADVHTTTIEKQLKIAIEGLEKYANEENWERTMYGAKDCFFIPNSERRINGFLLARRVLEELGK